MDNNRFVELWKRKYCSNSAATMYEVSSVAELALLAAGPCAIILPANLLPDSFLLVKNFLNFDYFELGVETEQPTKILYGTKIEIERTDNQETRIISGSSTCYFNKKLQRVLMQLRDNNTKYFPQHYAFPGGIFQESDSSLETTARREFLEETGVDLGLGPLQAIARHVNFKANEIYIVNYFLSLGEIEQFSCFEGASMEVLTRNETQTKNLVPYADLVAEYVFSTK